MKKANMKFSCFPFGKIKAKTKKASSSVGGSVGGFIGLIIGILIPTNGASLFTRITGGAIMGDSQTILMGWLYVGVAILICGAFGTLIGHIVE